MTIQLSIQSATDRQVVYTSSTLLRVGGAKENEICMPDLASGLLTIQAVQGQMRVYLRAEGNVFIGKQLLVKDQMQLWPAGTPLTLANDYSLVWNVAKSSRKRERIANSTSDSSLTHGKPNRVRQVAIVVLGLILIQLCVTATQTRESSLSLLQSLVQQKEETTAGQLSLMKCQELVKLIGINEVARVDSSDSDLLAQRHESLRNELIAVLSSSDCSIPSNLKERLLNWSGQ